MNLCSYFRTDYLKVVNRKLKNKFEKIEICENMFTQNPNIVNDECKKFVNELAFYLLTTPRDWRYPRDTKWICLQNKDYNDITTFINNNTEYLYKQFQKPKFRKNFDIFIDDISYENDDEDDGSYYEAQTKIYEVMIKMFPTLGCLHPDESDKIKDKFIPKLTNIKNMF